MLRFKDEVVFLSDAIREMFYKWLEGDPTTLSFFMMQDALAEMDDTLPAAICHEHDFPLGWSVGRAVRSLIVVTRSDGREFRVNTQIEFKDDRASIEWWQRNKDNHRRVVIEPTENGQYALTIAG